MENATAIAIKFAVVAMLTVFVLAASASVGYGQAVVLAAVFTAVSYPLIDLNILRRYGNGSAVLVDFVLATLIFRTAPEVMVGAVVSWGAALTAGGTLAVAELLLHTYMERTVLAKPRP